MAGQARNNDHGDSADLDDDRRFRHDRSPHPGPLMELLAIRLGRQKTPAKSLVIPQGDSDFLWAEARDKSYVPPAGEGTIVSLTRR